VAELEQWLPNAIQAATAVGQLLLGLGQRRWTQAQEWGETVEELSGLDRETLRRTLEGDPVAAELVGLALEAAARTASDDKRYLLAKVAAAALRGDTTPGQVDNLQLLLRTVIALDPPHVALLVTIGQSVDRSGQTNDEEAQRASRDKLAADWPGPTDLLGAVLATLERENLVETITDFNGTPRWVRVTDYGSRFLDHLLIDHGGWPPVRPSDSSAV